MCRYCENTIGVEKIEELEGDVGMLGTIASTLYLNGIVNDKRQRIVPKYPSLKMVLECNKDDDGIMVDIPISYCPFCGKELKEK